MPAVTTPGRAERKNVSACRHSGDSPLGSTGAAPVDTDAGHDSPYAPVAIATWFGFVSATVRLRPASEKLRRGRHRVTITVRHERGVTTRASLYAQRL
jgi:hypothetical protein